MPVDFENAVCPTQREWEDFMECPCWLYIRSWIDAAKEQQTEDMFHADPVNNATGIARTQGCRISMDAIAELPGDIIEELKNPNKEGEADGRGNTIDDRGTDGPVTGGFV